MFFNKEKKKSNFVAAKTPEARKRQREAIAAYYANKREQPKTKQTQTAKKQSTQKRTSNKKSHR